MGCRLCGCEEAKIVFKTRTHGAWRGTTAGPLLKCARCGHIYVHPGKHGHVYVHPGKPASSLETASDVDPTYLAHERPFRATWEKRLRDLGAAAKVPGRLLDVGCYAGFFLDMARRGGWDVYGVEPDRAGFDYSRSNLGLSNVSLGTLESVRYPAGFFDVVTLYHVVEHLDSPVDTMKEISRILKPGGLCILETPDCGFWMALTRSRFRYFQQDHLSYFTARSLSRLLQLAGFSAIRVRHVARVTNLRRVAETIGRYSSVAGSLLGCLIRSCRLEERLLSVNIGDVMIVDCRSVAGHIASQEV